MDWEWSFKFCQWESQPIASWILWKLRKSWIIRLHKENRKTGNTEPHRRGQDSCLDPTHTHTSRHLSSRRQAFFTMCSDFPVVLLFSVSVYPCVFLLFPHCWFSPHFPIPYLKEGLAGHLIIVISLFTGFCARPHHRSRANLGIGDSYASQSCGLNIASPSGITAQGSFLQWGSFSQRAWESCTMTAINNSLQWKCPWLGQGLSHMF